MARMIEGRGKAILIVEDEALIRFDLVDFFEDAGLKVYEAENADDAILLMEQYPDIGTVLTDVQMPGSMDGLKLAHYIRDRFPPALLIVASGALRLTAGDLPDGACFFAKPFDPRSVLRVVDAARLVLSRTQDLPAAIDGGQRR